MLLKTIYFEFLDNFPSVNTRDAYRNDLEDFVQFVGTVTEAQWTLKHLIDYRDFLAKNLAPTSVRRKLSSVISFTRWCVQRGILVSDPANGLKLPKPQVQNTTLAFTDDEVVRILGIPKKPMHQLMLLMLFNLGLRRSELTRIKFGDFEDDRGQLVLKIRGKGEKTRILPISDKLRAEIPTGKVDSLLFTVNGRELNGSTVYRIVKRYSKIAGVDRRVGAHSCRHTVISHLLDTKKVPIRDVADFAGHASVNTTSIYDRKRKGIQDSAALKISYGT